MSNVFQTCLKGFKLKRMVVEPKKWLNRLNRMKNRSTASSIDLEACRPPIQPVNGVNSNQLTSTDQGINSNWSRSNGHLPSI